MHSWEDFEEYVSYYHYHLNCRHIHDNKGDIKITVMEISQNTVESCLDVNSDPFDGN